MDDERIFSELNDEQRRAVETVRGPVCILAGAGSGKTTTITRRIANQVATAAFAAREVLAVTFTDKAATEMRTRLRALGVDGVAARTFHSAALAQLRHFAPDSVGRIIASKALPLRHLANSLPRAYRFRPAGDLATEVEWAKNRRIPPERYLDELGEHKPPIPPDLMERIYREYERRKAKEGLIDFEDLLERAIALLETDEHARAAVRDRYRTFTVDEYQDVNLLQQTLLELWVGVRDELCVVGDDYQAIYAFTGATPEYLLGMPKRYPHAAVVRLEANYRSTPEVLERANGLVPRLGGAEKTLRPVRPPGPAPIVQAFASTTAELAWLVEQVRALHSEGVRYEETAVLVRTNARTADYEEAFSLAEIPFQGASLLARDAARMMLRRLRSSTSRSVAGDVRRVATELGWLPEPPEGLGDREQTRQNDLARMIRLAETFDDGQSTIGDWIAELERRFDPRAQGAGVHLLTYHRAKGLEWDAVFLPRLEEKELPCRAARTPEEIDEERRLLYVGMTRAKRHLALTWSAAAKPSRFLGELGVTRPIERPHERQPEEDLPPLYGDLKAWRRRRAESDGVPAYVVFHDRTLAEVALVRPQTHAELASIPGVGPAKLERYGDEVLAEVAAAM